MRPRMLHACGWPERIIWSSQSASVWEVRLYVYLLFSSANPRQHCTANCHFRHTPPSSDWLDVSNTAQQLASQLTISCLFSSGHELTLFFLEFEVCTTLPFCLYNHSQLCVLTNAHRRLLPSSLLSCLSTSLSSKSSQTPSIALGLSTLWYRDGKSNYMEGLMLITLYLVIALSCASYDFSVFCRSEEHTSELQSPA